MRNLLLIIIPNNFGKHVNRTFQVKIVIIRENIMFLEKDKLLSKQKDVGAIFNKHFESITDSFNLFSWSEDASMTSENDTINSISKRFAFHRSIKAIKKSKLKANRDHEKNYK